MTGTFSGSETPKADELHSGPWPYDSRPDNAAHIFEVQALLMRAAGELQWRAVVHDQSKLHDPERRMFDEFTPLLRVHEYGTPEYRAAAKKVSSHCRNPLNDHHPECHGDIGVLGMHFGQLIEMCADWIAASRRNPNGDVIASVKMNAERFKYGPEVEELIRNTVRWLLDLESAPYAPDLPIRPA